jgi:hypothetical protein
MFSFVCKFIVFETIYLKLLPGLRKKSRRGRFLLRRARVFAEKWRAAPVRVKKGCSKTEILEQPHYL